MTRNQLLACLLAIALGASAAAAYPVERPDADGRRRPMPCVRDDVGHRRFGWRSLFEAMLPPALRARHVRLETRVRLETMSSAESSVESGNVVDELAALPGLACRAVGMRS